MDRATYDRMAEIDRDHWWFVARRRIIGLLKIPGRVVLETQRSQDRVISAIPCFGGVPVKVVIAVLNLAPQPIDA